MNRALRRTQTSSVVVFVVVVEDDQREDRDFLICKVIRLLLPPPFRGMMSPLRVSSLLCLPCRSHNVDDGPERLLATYNRHRQRAVA